MSTMANPEQKTNPPALRWLGVAGLLAWAVPAQALPSAPPEVGRYACVAHAKGWFESGMAPVFSLEVLPGSRYRVQTRQGRGGEGALDVSAWPDNAALGQRFDTGSAVAFLQPGGAPLMVGVYGEREAARTWLLRMKDDTQAYVRCGDAPVTARAAPAGKSATTSSGARGVNQPAPPVRLPAGSRLGGTFEPGRYACSVQSPGSERSFSFTYEFYDNGEWRRPKVRDEAGHYVTAPQTGRFDAFNDHLGTSTSQPDDTYAVYYRSAAGVSQLYAVKEVGNSSRETRCTREGPVQEASPQGVQAREAQAKEAARARSREEASARGQRNLRPPPPGGARWEGLYANETFHRKERVDPGPYGGFSRLVTDVWSTWAFLEFQPSGWVYLGLRPPQTPCNAPSVKDSGEPLCTTYGVEGGRLRIGHEDRGPVSRGDGGVRLGEAVFAAVPPLTPRRLAGSYQASRCEGALCEKTTWVFGADGTFSVIGLNQAVGVGAGPAGAPMPRGWTHTGQAEGRYRIEGQGLRLTDGKGDSHALAVFLYPPKDQTISIGGREFLRKGH
jgi:hypothetical protein